MGVAVAAGDAAADTAADVYMTEEYADVLGEAAGEE